MCRLCVTLILVLVYVRSADLDESQWWRQQYFFLLNVGVAFSLSVLYGAVVSSFRLSHWIKLPNTKRRRYISHHDKKLDFDGCISLKLQRLSIKSDGGWVYQQAAEAGHPDAKCNFTLCCKYGTGVELNWEEAFRLYREAGYDRKATEKLLLLPEIAGARI